MSEKIISGCHHVALSTHCIEKTLAFYKALGLKELRRWGEGPSLGVMLDMGDGCILEVFANGVDQPQSAQRFLHLALATDDVDLAYNTALSAGARPQSEPHDHVINSTPKPMPVRIAFVYGPSDELIEFFKVREEK